MYDVETRFLRICAILYAYKKGCGLACLGWDGLWVEVIHFAKEGRTQKRDATNVTFGGLGLGWVRVSRFVWVGMCVELTKFRQEGRKMRFTSINTNIFIFRGRVI